MALSVRTSRIQNLFSLPFFDILIYGNIKYVWYVREYTLERKR